MKAILNPIQFFSKNYLDGNATLPKLTDVNFDVLFDFNTKNTQLTAQSTALDFIMTLNDVYNDFPNREIDRIVLANTNIKDAVFTYFDAMDAEHPLCTLANNEKKDVVLEFPQVNTNKIRVNITSTNSDGIQIGQMRICKYILDLKGTSETTLKPIVSDGTIRTYNGNLISWLDYEKWGATITIQNALLEQINLIREYLDKDEFIIVRPFPVFSDADIYECRVPRPGIGGFNVNRWSGRLDLSIDLEGRDNARY